MSLFSASHQHPASQLIANPRVPLPAIVPVISGLDVAATHYGERVGGDFYDFVAVGPRLIFGLLDVAGQSADALTIAANVQDVFRSGVVELFHEGSCTNEAEALMELTVRINRRVMEVAGGVHACAAFAGCCNAEVGTLCYVNAGHSAGLLQTDSTISQLEATGLPLGLFAHATHDAPTFVLPPGGALVLVSRGLVEASGKSKKLEFGLPRVEESMLRSGSIPAEPLCQAVLASVVAFMGSRAPGNDISTLALVRVR